MRDRIERIALCFVVSGAVMPGCGTQDAEGGPDTSGSALAAVERAAAPRSAAGCSQESDCDAGLACIAGACQPCAAHGQCESDVCDRGAATPLGPGACVPEASVVYVDARAPRPDCFAADGTRATPVCDFRTAIPLAVGARYAIRVAPGRYFPFGVGSAAIAVFGPGDGSAIVGEEDNSRAVSIASGSRVVIDGLDFGNAVLTGMTCDSSSVKVLRATVRGDSVGIRSTDCDLELDQVRVIGSIRTGLMLAGTGTYRITNSYFAGGDLPAVVFDGSASGLFAFNTITGGGEIQPGGIDCGTTSRMIQDSIVQSSAAAGGARTVGACSHERVVVGSGDTRPDPGLIAIDPDLDPQGRLLDTPADRACCIDRGAADASSLYRDFYGTPRPQGAGNDIGAHELVQ
jgi:hypothetical protein